MAVTALKTPAMICNAALLRIGYPKRIGDLFDGSEASRAALLVYSQTRDDKLTDFEWGFAEGNAQLVLLKSAPPGGYIPPTQWNPAVNPPMGWNFEYAYPSDALLIRSLRPMAVFTPDYAPDPIEFREANDNTIGGEKVILCNYGNVYAVYTRQVTDPDDWIDPDFTEVLIEALAERLGPALGKLSQESLAAMKAAGTEGMGEEPRAEMERT